LSDSIFRPAIPPTIDSPMHDLMSHLYDIIWTRHENPIALSLYTVPSDEETFAEEPSMGSDEVVSDTESPSDDDAMATDELPASDGPMADDQFGLGPSDVNITAKEVEFQSVDLSQHGGTVKLPNMCSKMLVRHAYPILYDKINSSNSSYAILGQSGIGKCYIESKPALHYQHPHQERHIFSVMHLSAGFVTESQQRTRRTTYLVSGSPKKDSLLSQGLRFHVKLTIRIRGT